MPWLDMTLVLWTVSIIHIFDKVLHFTRTKDVNLYRSEPELEATFIFLHRWNIYICKTDERVKRQLAGTEKKETRNIILGNVQY